MQNRKVVLDVIRTDATPSGRIAVVGMTEIIGRRRSEELIATYVNPDGAFMGAAWKTQPGLKWMDENFSNKALFKEVESDFQRFINGCELIVLNAEETIDPFDFELKKMGANWSLKENVPIFCLDRCFNLLCPNKSSTKKNKVDIKTMLKKFNIEIDESIYKQFSRVIAMSEVYLKMTEQFYY